MEVHQLRYFCAVARSGSFTRAAEEEGVSQPTLSQQVRKLERDLGVALFERSGSGVRLTPAGRCLLPDAQAVLRQLAAAREALATVRQAVRGPLVVGCIPTVTPYLLAPALPDFCRRFPEVELHLVDHVTARLVEGLQSGDIDVAILSLPLGNRELVCAELLRDPLAVVVSEHHRLANAPSVRPADLRNERHLVLRDGHCLRGEMIGVCRRARVNSDAIVETDQLASIFALVAAGLGVAVVPRMAAHAAQGCRLVPLASGPARRIGYARARREFVPPAQQAFIGWLKERVRVRGR